jgi:predicted dehydrogenase
MDKVRWGLICTARINRRVIPAIRASARGELVAVASRDQMKANEYARAWGIPRAFGGYDAMLASNEVDVIYNSLPNHLHAEMSIKAMQAGKHVLCEKPLALTTDEVDRMMLVSQQTRMVLADALMYRHHPQTKAVRDFVQRGDLGQPLVFRGVFNFFIGDRNDVRLVPDYGGGSLWDIGIYPLTYAQLVFNSVPQWVFGTQAVSNQGVDEVFTGQMYYAGDQVAQIMSSFKSPVYTEVEIVGTEGRLVVNRPYTGMEDNRRVMYYPPADDQPYEIPVKEQELYQGEVDDMHAAILDGKPTYLRLAESRDYVRTVVALYQSARSGKKETLPR